MRIMVAGPGAIGSLFAARLAAAGMDVVLLDHNPGRARRLTRQGIRIETKDRTETHRVPVLCFSDQPTLSSPTADVVLLCVKAYDTAQAARDIHPVCDGNTLIVSIQNGMGNDRLLAEVYPLQNLLCATTGSGSTLLGDGMVREAGRGPLVMAPCDAIWTDRKQLLAQTLRSSGENVTRCDDVAALVWSKAILNAAINPLTVLYNGPNGTLLENPQAHALMLATAREGQTVAAARHISLHYSDAAEEVETVCRRTANNVSSMLQDHRAGRRTELDAINGAIVREAATAGISAAVNADLIKRILALGPAAATQ